MNPKVTLDQWRVLQAVVDCGGYGQAAEYLHRSQSSVSYAVNKLQHQLGVELLRLEGRRAQLTTLGEAMLRRARRLLGEAQALEEFAKELERGWEPEIKLVVDNAFPTSRLMRVLGDFAPLSRGTRVQLKEVVLSGAEDALLASEADLVISAIIPRGYLADTLFDVDFVAVAHPAHALLKQQGELTTRDLESELQVVIRDSGMAQRQNVGWLGAEHRWTVTSIATALEAVRNGLGFAWLPRHQIEPLLRNGQLAELPLREGRITHTQLYMIYGRPDDIGPATKQLAELFHHDAQDSAATLTPR